MHYLLHYPDAITKCGPFVDNVFRNETSIFCASNKGNL